MKLIMRIHNKQVSLSQLICLIIYYSCLQYLPKSSIPFIGKIARFLRYKCCTHIFKFCGKSVNIERLAKFGSGIDLCIGDHSGLGINCVVPSNIIIGKDVMMGPNCYIFSSNHSFERCDIPMISQGHSVPKQTIIEEDVWIGRNVIFTPGRTIKKGSIIGAGCVLSKDFPEYCVIAGNPSRLIRNRSCINHSNL